MSNLVKEKINIFALYSKVFNYGLIAFIFVSAISYIYFANVAVRALSASEKSKQEMQSLGVRVSEMESKRLLFDNSVSHALAKNLGFVEVKDQTFIIGKSKGSLSLK